MDVWLIKTDMDGNELWNKTFTGSRSDSGNHMQQTSDGGYIIIGEKPSYNDMDMWLVKVEGE